jgi:hypothetical protein
VSRKTGQRLPPRSLEPADARAIDQALGRRTDGPLLLNRWGNRMRRHNAAAVVSRLRARSVSHVE